MFLHAVRACIYIFVLFSGYESVFEKKAFSGMLEMDDIEAFFHECDLYPSRSEIEEATDVVSHGELHYLINSDCKGC